MKAESDTELKFYKTDNITKEELQDEMTKYGERLSTKYNNKIRNTIILFSISQILFVIASIFLWRTTYFLGYIPSFHNDIAWRKMLIPLFILIFSGFLFVFIKAINFIAKVNIKEKAVEILNICRYSIFVLIICFTVGIIISGQSLKSMKELQSEVGRDINGQWYTLYRMIYTVDNYLSLEEDQRRDIDYSLYVNQTCYRFNDSLHTKMHDLLVWCYDIAFKGVSDPQNKASADKTELILKELNDELIKICAEIFEKSDNERADLVRYDLPEAIYFRERINNLVDKYLTQTENTFMWIKG